MIPAPAILRSAHRQSLAIWSALAVLGAATGCRTAAPQPTTPTPRSGWSQQQPARTVPQTTSASTQGDAVTYVVQARPRFVITPDGGTYLVLAAGPVRIGSRSAWSVAYLAAPDRSAAPAGADERLGRAADALFRAQQSLAEVAGAEVFSVTALFGAPGGRGVSAELAYVRAADTWIPPTTPVFDEVLATPLLPPELDRDGVEERSAIDTALQFLGCVDQRDFDAAWDLSSAVVKATMSRVSFEQQLADVRSPGGVVERREAFHSFDPGAFIPGDSFEIAFERPRTLEVLVLRMDDDMSWRVAALRTFTPAPADDYGIGGVSAAAASR